MVRVAVVTRKKAIAKVDACDASFDEWFIAQFGERPDSRPIFEIQESAKAHDTQARYARLRLALVEEWESRRHAALMAWQASKDQR